jgi:CBS domain containing-hemolysin-like protein
MELLWIIPLMIVLMAIKAFFSGSEIALVSADKIHLRHRASKGSRGAAEVLKASRHPELILATTLVGTNLAIVSLTTLGTLAMLNLFGERGELYAVLLLSPLFLVLTEVVPKSVFQQKANQLAPIIIWPLRTVMVLLFPVVVTFAAVARLAARLTGAKGAHHVFITREMVRSVLDTAEKAGDMKSLSWNELKQAVRLTDITVGEVMIPMAEVTTIGHHETTRRAIELACARGHFRLPVYQEEANAVTGVLAMDLWKLMSPAFAEASLADLMTPAEFVIANQPVYELLPILRGRQDHMAVVVDEFGSAIGMITMEDIQEAVVGEFVGVGYHIPGYVHREKQVIQAIDDDTFSMNGRVPIGDVNDLLGIELPVGEAHTIGGFVTARLRHLPKPEEFITAAGYRFTVEEATGKVVARLRVEPE